MSRYDGKPFLRLLDSYILDAIGQLTDDQNKSLIAMEPKLSEIYGESGSWQQIVAKQMDFPDSFAESINKAWSKYLNHFKNLGQSVHPNEFVEKFIESNFPEISSD